VIEIREVLVLQPLSMRALHLDGRRRRGEMEEGLREEMEKRETKRGEMKINDEIDIINLILTLNWM
jgi:hypothetical protein